MQDKSPAIEMCAAEFEMYQVIGECIYLKSMSK